MASPETPKMLKKSLKSKIVNYFNYYRNVSLHFFVRILRKRSKFQMKIQNSEKKGVTQRNVPLCSFRFQFPWGAIASGCTKIDITLRSESGAKSLHSVSVWRAAARVLKFAFSILRARVCVCRSVHCRVGGCVQRATSFCPMWNCKLLIYLHLLFGYVSSSRILLNQTQGSSMATLSLSMVLKNNANCGCDPPRSH